MLLLHIKPNSPEVCSSRQCHNVTFDKKRWLKTWNHKQTVVRAIENDGKGSRAQKTVSLLFFTLTKNYCKNQSEITRQSIIEENERTLSKWNQLTVKYSKNNSLSWTSLSWVTTRKCKEAELKNQSYSQLCIWRPHLGTSKKRSTASEAQKRCRSHNQDNLTSALQHFCKLLRAC